LCTLPGGTQMHTVSSPACSLHWFTCTGSMPLPVAYLSACHTLFLLFSLSFIDFHFLGASPLHCTAWVSWRCSLSPAAIPAWSVCFPALSPGSHWVCLCCFLLGPACTRFISHTCLLPLLPLTCLLSPASAFLLFTCSLPFFHCTGGLLLLCSAFLPATPIPACLFLFSWVFSFLNFFRFYHCVRFSLHCLGGILLSHSHRFSCYWNFLPGSLFLEFHAFSRFSTPAPLPLSLWSPFRSASWDSPANV